MRKYILYFCLIFVSCNNTPNIRGSWQIKDAPEQTIVTITKDKIIYPGIETNFEYNYRILSDDIIYIERLWLDKTDKDYVSECVYSLQDDILIIYKILPSLAEIYPPIFTGDLILVRADGNSCNHSTGYVSGHAVGIIGCYDIDNNYHCGVFIVTNQNDSLLSFGNTNDFYNYVEKDMVGIYARHSDITRKFQYRLVNEDEFIQWICPLDNMLYAGMSNVYDYKQVTITEILY